MTICFTKVFTCKGSDVTNFVLFFFNLICLFSVLNHLYILLLNMCSQSFSCIFMCSSQCGCIGYASVWSYISCMSYTYAFVVGQWVCANLRNRIFHLFFIPLVILRHSLFMPILFWVCTFCLTVGCFTINFRLRS